MKKIFLVFIIAFISSCEKKWDYFGENSPEKWGELKEEYKFCKIGYNQSPINIVDEFKEEEIKFFYTDSEIEKERKDYVMRINFFNKDFLTRGKKKYFLRYFEFHHPSEHLVKSKPYSMELEIIHKSEDEQFLILGIFLEIGKENAKFDKLIDLLLDKNIRTNFDLSKIVKNNDKMFFYDGSFTTPPCKEGVKWYVMKTPIEISKEQMDKIIKSGILAKSNARPVQKYNPEKY